MATALPDTLLSELRRMRRDPAQFTLIKMAQCKFGCGKEKAYSLTHPDSPDAGTWCPVHGWLFFDSVKIRPTGEEYVPRPRKRKRAA